MRPLHEPAPQVRSAARRVYRCVRSVAVHPLSRASGVSLIGHRKKKEVARVGRASGPREGGKTLFGKTPKKGRIKWWERPRRNILTPPPHTYIQHKESGPLGARNLARATLPEELRTSNLGGAQVPADERASRWLSQGDDTSTLFVRVREEELGIFPERKGPGEEKGDSETRSQRQSRSGSRVEPLIEHPQGVRESMVRRFCNGAVALGIALTACAAFPRAVMAIDLSRFYGHINTKRSDACHPYEPFKCPGDGICISIQYLCDGAPDCQDGYDEDSRLCTAAKRPPVEETATFLQSLLASHGPNYLEKLFGNKARDTLKPLGGVEKVAIALSESQTIEDFGAALHLMRSDLEHLRSVFMAVENGDLGMLKSIGIKDSELGDVKFFLEKLVKTGFLD